MNAFEPTANKDYYRELSGWLSWSGLLKPINICFQNNGTSTLYKIRATATLQCSEASVLDKMPSIPERRHRPVNVPVFPLVPVRRRYDIYVEEDFRKNRYQILARADEIYPGELVIFDDIYIGSETNGQIPIVFTTLGENIRKPLTFELQVENHVNQKTLSFEDLREYYPK